MGNVLQAVLISLVEVFIGVPTNHRVRSVVVDNDSRVVFVVFTAFNPFRS